MIKLYLKTHNQTGLKYLGKTTRDPYRYQGSGKYWMLHLNKHGEDISTEVLYQCEDMDEFKKVALEYSDKLNIVESKEYANLMVENGTGGSVLGGKKSPQAVARSAATRTGAKRTDKMKERMRIAQTGSKKTPEQNAARSERCTKNPPRVRPVIVEGVRYGTMTECAKVYGLASSSSVGCRILSPGWKWVEWNYEEK